LPSCRSPAAFRRLRGAASFTGCRSAVLSATPLRRRSTTVAAFRALLRTRVRHFPSVV
jgi:hypothetical protein